MRVVIALVDFEYKGLMIHKGDMVSGNLFDGRELGQLWSRGLITWYKIPERVERRAVKRADSGGSFAQKSLLAFL